MADIPLSTIVGGSTRRVPTSFEGRVGGVTSSSNIGNTAALVSHVGDLVLSGSQTADTYKVLLTVSAPGTLKLLSSWRMNDTSRTLGVRLKLNGVTVYDITDLGPSYSNRGLNVVGAMTNSGATPSFDSVPFDTMEVAVKSSLTETNAIGTMIIYNLD